MIASANPLRVELCRAYGAEVEFAPDAHRAFGRVEAIVREAGRTLIHPFEGRTTALGTATLGLELCEQLPSLDAVIVPIGGGGLCSGVSSAVKLLNPCCEVFGVEPYGADSMYRSFAVGAPVRSSESRPSLTASAHHMRSRSRSSSADAMLMSSCVSRMTSYVQPCVSCIETRSLPLSLQVPPPPRRCSGRYVSAWARDGWR